MPQALKGVAFSDWTDAQIDHVLLVHQQRLDALVDDAAATVTGLPPRELLESFRTLSLQDILSLPVPRVVDIEGIQLDLGARADAPTLATFNDIQSVSGFRTYHDSNNCLATIVWLVSWAR